jgi:hypothetical protein
MQNLTFLPLIFPALPDSIDGQLGNGIGHLPFWVSYGRVAPHRGICGLCGNESIRHQFFRAELRGTGVTVSSLCPGPVYTEFTEVAARPGAKRDRTPEFVHVSAEEVARTALAAIERDSPLVIPGFIMKLGMSLVRIMPLWILRLASRFLAKRS